MNSILQLKKANCKNCYKCIRECPVKSIKFADHQANIIKDECILCGACFVACPQNAKQVRNDVPTAKGLIRAAQLAGGKPVVLSLAPSFIADFAVNGLQDLQDIFKAMGFSWAEETAVGAQIVTREYQRMVDRKEQDIIITTCCHTVNTLIQRYYPQAIPYMAHTLSPMLAHAKYIKERHPGAMVVFAGPCLSKKAEAEQYGYVDCVLTFDELRDWMEETQAAVPGLELPAPLTAEEKGRRSRSYPISGGILKTMRPEDTGYDYIVVDGVRSCMDALREIEAGGLQHCFIEMSACKGSCVGGPAMHQSHSRTPVANMAKVERFVGRTPGDFDLPDSEGLDLHKDLPFEGVHTTRPGELQIRQTLIKMGKTLPEHELNCGSCGYNTCREKAIAVCEGKADLSMCLPFLKERAESFSDTIISNTPNAILVLDENLNIQQINKTACQLFRLSDPRSVVGTPVVTILNPAPYMEVMDKNSSHHREELRHYLAEYDRYVEESVVFDTDYRVVISVMKDVTEEEKEANLRAETRAKTAEITDKVIEKQMRVVQEIASLLGETTAETKIALTKLKDVL